MLQLGGGGGFLFTIERRQRIRRLLLEQKRVEVSDLSRLFGLSESTIRRDLDVLEKEGFLRKTYGGAVLADGGEPVENDDPLTREREKIARIAAEMVEEGEAVFLGGGPTCLLLAGCLAEKRRLTVATNDLDVALELTEAPYVSVRVTGGDLLSGTSTLIGQGAIDSLRGSCFNRAFFSPAGADLRFGYAAASHGEAQLMQAVINITQEPAALLDHTPFGRLALAPVMALDRLPVVITSNLLPGEYKAFFIAHQVRLFTAFEIAHPEPRRDMNGRAHS